MGIAYIVIKCVHVHLWGCAQNTEYHVFVDSAVGVLISFSKWLHCPFNCDDDKETEMPRSKVLRKKKTDYLPYLEKFGRLGLDKWGCFKIVKCISFFVFQERISLCSPGCPGSYSVDQASPDLCGYRHVPPHAAVKSILMNCCRAGEMAP